MKKHLNYSAMKIIATILILLAINVNTGCAAKEDDNQVSDIKHGTVKDDGNLIDISYDEVKDNDNLINEIWYEAVMSGELFNHRELVDFFESEEILQNNNAYEGFPYI